jgi:hypothetical protein
MKTIEFKNFGRWDTGQVVTHWGDLLIVWSCVEHGRWSLTLVQYSDAEPSRAIRHGIDTVVGCALAWLPAKQYRRVRRFLADKGLAKNLVLSC